VRFDVIAAIVLGILIPTLETVRRGIGYWSVSFTTMFEDYLRHRPLCKASPVARVRRRVEPVRPS
jgi:hypothetical protein